MALYISRFVGGNLDHGTSGYTHYIRTDREAMQTVRVGARDHTVLTSVKPLMAVFRRQGLELPALLQAKQVYFPDINDPTRSGSSGQLVKQIVGGDLPPGQWASMLLLGNVRSDVGSSVPYPQDGIIERTGQVYFGAERHLMYSSFDTERNIAPNDPDAWDVDLTRDTDIRAETIRMLGADDDIDGMKLHQLLFESVLDQSPDRGSAFFRFEPADLIPPWPAYASYQKQGAHKKIVAFIRDGGYDPYAVLAYEKATHTYGEYVEREIQAYIDETTTKQAEDQALSGSI